MGLLDSVLGNASEIDPAKAQADLEPILITGEDVHKAYQVFRDSFIFTGYRLLLIDRQGMTGKKMQYHSIPYKSITQFSIETAGSFDMDAELKIWISGIPDPISATFNKKLSIYELQKVLAHYVFGGTR